MVAAQVHLAARPRGVCEPRRLGGPRLISGKWSVLLWSLGPSHPRSFGLWRVVTGQSSQQVCFGFWKLFARRKFPTDKLRRRQRQLLRQIPSTPTRRPSKPGQLTSIARPAICFSVFPTLCHQRSRGELNPSNVYHIRGQRMPFPPARVPWSCPRALRQFAILRVRVHVEVDLGRGGSGTRC